MLKSNRDITFPTAPDLEDIEDIQRWMRAMVSTLKEMGENIFDDLSRLENLPVYANNSAAVAGGLVAGDFYRTGADPDIVCVVH
jgi:hypothetical protein